MPPIAKPTARSRRDVIDTVIEWVTCLNCGRWELYENSGLTTPFNEITDDTDFTCGLCLLDTQLKEHADLFQSVNSDLSGLRDAHAASDTRFAKIEASLSASSRTMGQLTSDLKTLTTKLDDQAGLISNSVVSALRPELLQTSSELITTLVDTASTTIRADMEESQLQDLRRYNVVVFNIPESPNDTAGQQTLAEIFYACHLPHDIVFYRIGRTIPPPDARPRPYKVELRSVKQKSTLLQHISYLRQDRSVTLFARPDRTPKQQVAFQKAYEELQTRLQAGETNIVIRDYKVVSHPPRQSPPGPINAESSSRVGSLTPSTNSAVTLPVSSFPSRPPPRSSFTNVTAHVHHPRASPWRPPPVPSYRQANATRSQPMHSLSHPSGSGYHPPISDYPSLPRQTTTSGPLSSPYGNQYNYAIPHGSQRPFRTDY